MTNRIFLDPNYLPSRLSADDLDRNWPDIRQYLIDSWAIISPYSEAHSGDHTVTGNAAHERCIMTNTVAAIVTLPELPDDLTEVTVKRAGAQVTINGNGKTIDGSATKILGTLYDGLNLIYTDAAGEWSIV